MNILTTEHLTKAYSERVLLDDAAFSLQEGEKVGVIGTNGMGKSTLLKILAGVEEPDGGSVVTASHVKIGYLPQTPVFEREQTVLDAVCGNKKGDEPGEREHFADESEAKAMLLELGLADFAQPVSELSGGQKKRVALAAVLLQPVDILILDEPTNHLDSQMAGWLEERLLKYRGALVMVTHDRYFLDRVASRIVEVDRGKIYSYPGSYSKFVQLKEQRLNMEDASERKRQSILRTELEWLARGARARSTKQKAHIQRIQAMQEQKAPQREAQMEMSSVSSRMGRKTIEVTDLKKSFGGRVLFSDYSYIFLKGERIGIVGGNGCGKSTLLKILTGDLEPDSGAVEIGQTIKIGYFSQENEYLDERLKAIEYVREGAEYIQTRDGRITASALMERFLFDGTMQWTQIAKLSGGEKRRLYLLRILMEAPNVLILDEPTNDLDIQTLTILEDYLDSFDGIVIAVSHDRYFLDRVVRRIFAFENGRIRQYEGGYSDYLRASAARTPGGEGSREQEKGAPKAGIAHGGNASQESPEAGAGKKPQWQRGERKLKFTFKEQREFETIDEEIAALEARAAALEEEMMANATNSAKLSALLGEKEETERALEEKMERWVYLNDLAEQIEAQQ